MIDQEYRHLIHTHPDCIMWQLAEECDNREHWEWH